MNNPGQLRVCFLSAECAPYSKVGGLGDMVAGLSRALREAGADVRVVTPLYRHVPPGLSLVPAADSWPVRMGELAFPAALWAREGPPTDYFVEGAAFFDRDGIYADAATGRGYDDDFERFNFFVLAALEGLPQLGWKPDLIHCHDYHSALAPPYLKLDRMDNPFFNGIATILTIHNLAYQGVFDAACYPLTGLSAELARPPGPFEFHGKINLLKAGICCADSLSTVSPRYAAEIQEPQMGCGLQEVVRGRADRLTGILNGIDDRLWDPAGDPFLFAPYSQNDLSGKWENRRQLRGRLGLPEREAPLVGMIARLVEQKGLDLVLEAWEDLRRLECQWVFLGQGNLEYHEALQKAAAADPQRVSVQLKFDEELAHQIEAGSDIFLMPSRYEPCGLNQMYSLRYGTPPIVHHTGGLADTVCDQREEQGTGFVFRRYSAPELVETVRRALEAWRDRRSWRRLMQTGMSQNFSWRHRVSQYLALYRRTVEQQ